MNTIVVQPDVKYSVVVPVFNEEASLPELSERIANAFRGMAADAQFEIVFVNDGSIDRTPDVIRELARGCDHIRGVTLRRNCGKSIALMTGFRFARGSIVMTMDGDLQDNPEDIPVLLHKLSQEQDLVCGWRQKR